MVDVLLLGRLFLWSDRHTREWLIHRVKCLVVGRTFQYHNWHRGACRLKILTFEDFDYFEEVVDLSTLSRNPIASGDKLISGYTIFFDNQEDIESFLFFLADMMTKKARLDQMLFSTISSSPDPPAQLNSKASNCSPALRVVAFNSYFC